MPLCKPDGVEAWADWRRLDIPHLPVGPGAFDSGNKHYPYRLWWDVADNWEGVLSDEECTPPTL
ncbi:MAG: hypothetical protein IJQ96_02370 [Bacteroidales bacterium]|nr:hypothetical protein [Bacteroidales bacterium]